MRILGVFCTFALVALLIASPGYAQDHDNGKPQAQEAPRPKDNDRARENEKPQANEDKKADHQGEHNAKHDDNRSRDDMNAGPQEDRNRPDANRSNASHPDANRPEERQQREQRPADNRGDMARNDNQRRAGGGRHIPDDQFRSHFGRPHTFHVQRTQIVNVSQPVVVYGGYSFQLVDPWPAEWSYDDDCYIDYVDDEYYLFDVMHPGLRIAVFVVE